MVVNAGGVTQPAQIGAVTLVPGGKAVVAVSRQAANFVAALLAPMALLALVFGLWRLGTDLDWTQEFVIDRGLFSHWQVWIALAAAIKMSESLLKPGRRKT
jgi:hypothetical protein